MAEDIVPGLLEGIKTEFQELYDKSDKAAALLKKVQAGTATYAQAQEYAIEVSRLIGKAWEKFISSATLPDGEMYYNIASRLIPSMLDENHALVADYAAKVQQQLNQKAGIGIRAQVVPVDTDRENGLVNLAASREKYDDISAQLKTAMENYSQAVVDSTLKKNVDFQGRAGLSPRIIRRAESGACKWCRALAGVYDYPDVPRDVYRRHENCRCVVEYDPGTGKRQNVHTKQWTTAEERAKIEARKQVGLEESSSVIASKYKRFDYSKAVFAGTKDINWHWEKHSEEFTGWTKEQYLSRARELMMLPLQEGELEQVTRSDGSVSRYCFSTNEFVATTNDGNLRTFFKPKFGKEYWDDEHSRN